MALLINICNKCNTKLAVIGDKCNFCIEEELQEFEKCKNNPYYFATKYFTIKHKNKVEKFTTKLTEKEFNDLFYHIKNENLEKTHIIFKKRQKSTD